MFKIQLFKSTMVTDSEQLTWSGAGDVQRAGGINPAAPPSQREDPDFLILVISCCRYLDLCSSPVHLQESHDYIRGSVCLGDMSALR